MRLLVDVVSRYLIDDWDTLSVVLNFDEPEGGSVLEVGAHDEPISNILTEHGFKVIGIDLREYDKNLPPCNYTYIRNDFCNLPDDFWRQYRGSFDTAIAISCIEHFGMGTYKEGNQHLFYDVLAMRNIWDLLKPNGSCYLTVPFGKFYREAWPHWRIYDMFHMNSRLVQDFIIEQAGAVVAGPIENWDRGESHPGPTLLGERISIDEAMTFEGEIPHLSMCLRLRKTEVQRLAPDGR